LGQLFENAFGAVGGVPEGLARAVSFVVALTIVVFLHMVVGEMVPKNIAIAGPERTLLALARANRAYVTLFRPVIRLLNTLANAGTRLLGVEPRDELEAAATAEEIAIMLGASREVGLIEEVAHDLLTGALDFGDRPVSSVMVRRDAVVAVSRESTVAEAERVILATGHSRLPVTRRDLDDIIGFVHAKDLLTLTPDAQGRPLPLSRIRRMLVLPATRSLEDALVAMRRARVHFAVVTDDADRTAGIVTLEDIIEDLVGDITDESDQPSPRRPRIRRRVR
jgi:CBS domain containing-hemolysin-like protein